MFSREKKKRIASSLIEGAVLLQGLISGRGGAISSFLCKKEGGEEKGGVKTLLRILRPTKEKGGTLACDETGHFFLWGRGGRICHRLISRGKKGNGWSSSQSIETRKLSSMRKKKKGGGKPLPRPCKRRGESQLLVASQGGKEQRRVVCPVSTSFLQKGGRKGIKKEGVISRHHGAGKQDHLATNVLRKKGGDRHILLPLWETRGEREKKKKKCHRALLCDGPIKEHRVPCSSI